MSLFGGALILGTAIAVFLAKVVLPAIGDRAGAFLFNPGEEVAPDPHAGAIAKLAQGDPEGAIEDYQAILKRDPADTLALSEIARVCCRELGDTARAATVIERALDGEWPREQGSFLANRLADIYLLQDDPLRARQVLLKLAETMDATKYAANAQHRLREIDRAIETGVAAPVYFDGAEREALPPAAEETEGTEGTPQPRET